MDGPALKKAVEGKYLATCAKIFKTDLNLANKVTAYNQSCVGLLRYYFVARWWSKKEIVDLERKTRNVLRQTKSWCRNQAVERFYLPRQHGGLGMISLQVAQDQFLLSMEDYLGTSEDPFVREICEAYKWGRDNPIKRFPKGKNLLIRAGEVRERLQIEPELKGRRACEKALKSWNDNQLAQLKSKPKHGRFWQDEAGKATFGWLQKGNVRSETAAIIMTAQDGSTATNAYRARVWRLGVSDKCRFCGQLETIDHVLNLCEGAQWTSYKQRHDDVCRQIVIAVLTQAEGLTPAQAAARSKGYEGTKVSVHWDPMVATDKTMAARRPDIVIRDLVQKWIYIVEVAVCLDTNVRGRTEEKRAKYEPLATDMARTNKGWRTQVVPLVVGSLGTTSAIEKEAKQLQPVVQPEALILSAQRAAVFGSVMAIKRHLAHP